MQPARPTPRFPRARRLEKNTFSVPACPDLAELGRSVPTSAILACGGGRFAAGPGAHERRRRLFSQRRELSAVPDPLREPSRLATALARWRRPEASCRVAGRPPEHIARRLFDAQGGARLRSRRVVASSPAAWTFACPALCEGRWTSVVAGAAADLAGRRVMRAGIGSRTAESDWLGQTWVVRMKTPAQDKQLGRSRATPPRSNSYRGRRLPASVPRRPPAPPLARTGSASARSSASMRTSSRRTRPRSR